MTGAGGDQRRESNRDEDLATGGRTTRQSKTGRGVRHPKMSPTDCPGSGAADYGEGGDLDAIVKGSREVHWKPGVTVVMVAPH